MGGKAFTASINKRDRRRPQRSGGVVVQTRFVVSFREPRTGRRKQLFFARHKDAVAMRDALVTSVVTGTYAEAHTNLTVAEVVDYWLCNRQSEVKASTWDSYRQAAGYITGPLLVGTQLERHVYARTGEKPEGAQLIEMLGPRLMADLTTADIRSWHKTLTAEVSGYTANVAKKYLRAALAIAAEDFHLRVPPMPTMRGRGRPSPGRRSCGRPRSASCWWPHSGTRKEASITPSRSLPACARASSWPCSGRMSMSPPAWCASGACRSATARSPT